MSGTKKIVLEKAKLGFSKKAFYSSCRGAKSNQYTLALLKPDLFTQPQSVEAVLKKFIPGSELKIIQQKTISWSVKDAQHFYAEHHGKFFFQRLTDYLSSGPFIALVLEGRDAIANWRRLIGPTRPDNARLNQPGTLRAHFGLTDTRNSFHGSDSPTTAKKEIGILFPELDPKRLE